MKSFALSAAALLAALLPTAHAQTHTKCNPLEEKGCPSMPALGGNATFDFKKQWNPDIWKETNAGSFDLYPNSTSLSVEKQGESPTFQSTFYIFFGRVEVIMKAAPGRGIVSSAILQSECLDEIDWEFLGTEAKGLTNYYGKGNTTYDKSRGLDLDLPSKPQDDYHNYTIDWTRERIQWIFDDKIVRELKFGDALGGKNYPQTPMNVRIGVWSGGDVDNNSQGTVEWAGGETDFNQAPFVMAVQKVYVEDYTLAKEYSWDDMDASGEWQKVKVVKMEEGEAKSPTLQEIEKPHGVKGRWQNLSKTAQIAIIASICGFVALVALFILFCCIKQRRAGRREFNAYQAGVDKEHADAATAKQQWEMSHKGAQSQHRRI